MLFDFGVLSPREGFPPLARPQTTLEKGFPPPQNNLSHKKKTVI